MVVDPTGLDYPYLYMTVQGSIQRYQNYNGRVLEEFDQHALCYSLGYFPTEGNVLFAGFTDYTIYDYIEGNPDWELSYTVPVDLQPLWFTYYNGKLYTGGSGVSGTIYSYDGVNWSLDYTSSQIVTYCGVVFEDKLYVGAQFGKSNIFDGKIHVNDYGSWGDSLVINEQGSFVAMAEHNGKLYAVTNDSLYEFNGTSWALKGTTPEYFKSLCSYNGMLWAGTWQSGIYYSYDCVNWELSSLNNPSGTRLIVYQNELYASGGYGNTNLYVYASSLKSGILENI